MQFTPLRTAIILIVTVLGILFTVPSFVSKETLANWPGWLPKQTMVLGLDLQGGSHLLLQVNREGIVAERIKELRRDARSILANDNGIGNIITTGEDSITIELTDPTQLQAAKTALQAMQNTISGSVFTVGGVSELAFSDTHDGKIVIWMTPEGIN